MQLRVFLIYKFFEPHPMLKTKNEWIELKSWTDMDEVERGECQWPWIKNVRNSDKRESGGVWEHVGTEIPGGTFHALRQVALKQIRLNDVEMVEKKGMTSSEYWQNEDASGRKKKKKKYSENCTPKIQFFVGGTNIELIDPEDKIQNRRQYIVNVYLKKNKARAA